MEAMQEAGAVPAVSANSADPVIQFRDVAVCYAPSERYPVNALEGINFDIASGEWVFLVGPSGAGKSTILKLLYGAAHAARGQVLVEGRDVSSMGPHEIPLLRRRIGVIFQDFLLMPQKTVWENVAYALQVIGRPQKLLAREVPRALETVGLHNKATMRPGQLSGGEQQRVAIARAIVNRPALVLADEPTGNLDPQTGADIIAVLQKINAEGTTVVMATHDRAVVDAMRRRVVRLAEGRVHSDDVRGVYRVEDGVLYQPGGVTTAATTAASTSTPAATAAPSAASSTERSVTPKAAPPVPAPSVVSAPVAPRAVPPASVSAPPPPLVSPPLVSEAGDAADTNGAARAPWRSARNGRAASDAASNSPSRPPETLALDGKPEPEPDAPQNLAPLGSPENPLVQFNRPAPPRGRHQDHYGVDGDN
jgi:cell division transport system ATP-binding protein